MKRRDFLKILSAAPLVAAVPALAKTNKPATPLYIKATNEPIGQVTDWSHVAEAGRLMDAADVSNEALGMIGAKGGNNFDANFSKKVAKAFLDGFEKSRVMK